ncbi:MAG: flagellar export protein FliJ [Pelovirga sp.]
MTKPFRLESVRKYRSALEDQAQEELARSLRQKNRLLLCIDEQHADLRAQDLELKRRQQTGLSMAEIDLYETRINYCRRRCNELGNQLRALEARILRQREDLIEAARARQVMDKLKERQNETYRQEQERKERRDLDEISLRDKGKTP